MERDAKAAAQVLNLWVNIQQEQLKVVLQRLEGVLDAIGQQVLAAFEPI